MKTDKELLNLYDKYGRACSDEWLSLSSEDKARTFELLKGSLE